MKDFKMRETESGKWVYDGEVEDTGLNVLSLCDGIGCARIALQELGIKIDHYYASEIDKAAIAVEIENFPDTTQLGDVTLIKEETLAKLPKIDLVCFGSPCQSNSKATAGRPEYSNGLKGKSGLFYDCVRILNWIKLNNNHCIKFLVENVETNHKNDLKEMSDLLGVEPILIDAGLFSAQERKRWYWTNIPLNKLPLNNDLVLSDILEPSEEIKDKYWYKESWKYKKDIKPSDKVIGLLDIKGHDIIKRINNREAKCQTLTACTGGNHQKKVLDYNRDGILTPRKLTPTEYRRLQCIPNWFVMNESDTNIYNQCGNGWNIEVIKFIFNRLK